METLRRMGWMLPILALVRHQDLTLRRRLFALGAGDVLTLPANAADLQHRLRAALGHQGAHEQPRTTGIVRAGGLTLAPAGRRVDDGAGWTARLTRQETALLERLMQTPGEVVGTQELLDRLWPTCAPATGNPLAVLVRRLRAKLIRPGAPSGYVQTAPRQGYTFEARATPRTPYDVPTSDTPMVLVVEDDRATAQMCQAVLEMIGCRVEQGVGPQAPIMARTLHPQVILLDLNMPGMDGIGVWEQLRANPRTAAIPVIAMSTGRNLRGRARELRADDYLAKPFSADDLMLRVGRWTRGAPTMA
jgi:DNA-binding response OmpR family regulator